MKLVRKDIDARDGSGSVTLLPQEPEDMWHLHNLIRAHDTLRAPALRKISTESSTGATTTQKVRTTLTITVSKTDFDPSAGELHVSGRVSAENPYVPMGSHHTLDLELHRQFGLSKGGEGWDSIALEMLNEATDLKKRAQVWAVIMQEGMANICLVTEFQTVLRQRVEVPIPRKRTGHGADAHDKGLGKFFDTTLKTVLRHVDINATTDEGKQPPLLLASPGFTAQAFLKYLTDYAQSNGDKALLSYARASVIVSKSSSGHVHALGEVLQSPAVMKRLSDTKYARETQLMDKFMELMRQDEGKAWYGPKEVIRVVEKGAVGRGGGVLLISNKLFRSEDVRERKKWVALVEKVRQEEGGEVRVLSSSHESGKKLENLGDIAAILTYPLPDLDLDEEEEDEDEPDEPEKSRAADGKGGFGGVGIINGQNHDR